MSRHSFNNAVTPSSVTMVLLLQTTAFMCICAIVSSAHANGAKQTDFFDPPGTQKLRYSSSVAVDDSNLDTDSLTPSETPNLGPATPAAEQYKQTEQAEQTEHRNVWTPAPGTSWQIQYSGELDTSQEYDMYDIDLADTPRSVISSLKARGIAVICYFSAGSIEDWREDVFRFPEHIIGKSNGWEGEKWLDISALSTLAPIMSARLDLALEKGCTGVDPDNVDGHHNDTGFTLTAQHQLDYSIWLAEQAHARGLSIGLKNNLAQVRELEPYYDWALNESCNQYNECHLLSPFVDAGKAVFGIEYKGNPDTFCSNTNALNFDFLKKPLNLGAERLACR